MLGMNAFAQGVNVTAVTKQEIGLSTDRLSEMLRRIKEENSKKLKGTQLELVQLMEQGDQVVKSPWASWQFGLNYMYNNWSGSYKGRGDKKEKYPFEGIFTRSTDIFERSVSPLSKKYKELETSTDITSTSSNRRVGLPWQYGITSTTQVQEKLGILFIGASIKPKDVSISKVDAPSMAIQTPEAPNLQLPELVLPRLEVPEPKIQNVQVHLPEPNTNPFAEYVFNRETSGYFRDWRSWYKAENPDSAGPKWEIRPYQDGKGDVYWAGYDPKDGKYKQGAGIYGKGLTEGAGNPLSTDPKRNYENKGTNNTDTSGKNWDYQLDTSSSLTPENKRRRPGVLLYLNDSADRKDKNGFDKRGFYLKDTVLHLAGDVNGAGLSGGTMRTDKTEKRVKGQIGIHTVSDGELENIRAFLYGKATFHSIETWHTGKTKYTDVTVNIEDEDNSVFLIYPSTYDNLIWHAGKTASKTGKEVLNGPYNRRGIFEGKVNVNMDSKSKRNIIYNQLGVQGVFDIVNEGEYKIKGQGNIVYSGLGYSPNFENMRDKTYRNKNGEVIIGFTNTDSAHFDSERAKDLTPTIQIKKSVNMIGDNNIGLFFSEKRPIGDKEGEIDVLPYPISKPKKDAEWEKSVVGIYQGQIQFKANIGTEEQESAENSGDVKYTETNVGIYARSGQREGIVPSKDLGAAKNWDQATNSYKDSVFDFDKVHSLQVNDLAISFGKHSKQNIMIAAENGTVIDVARDENSHTRLPIMTGTIKDYDSIGVGEISADDTTNKAASGTIIAFSKGVWKNSIHNMSPDTGTALENKVTEINIGRDVEMTGRYLKTGLDANGNEEGVSSIAYLAKDGGSVNMLKNTVAKGFGSIIAYAEGKDGTVNSKVKVEGTITAKDEWAATDSATKKYLYKNIGALAKKDGEIELKGNIDIYGIGAIADGENAKVNFISDGNKIKTGKDGALVALNGGHIQFSGGTIVHSENEAKDHDEATPFYADTNSKINFTGPTEVQMGNGILMQGLESDYTGISGSATKYNGMEKITVKLTSDDVKLGIEKGETLNWVGTSSGLETIKNKMKLVKIDKNGHKYKVYYVDGNFNLNTDLNLDDTNNEFYNLGLANEVFTISGGKKISSTTGKGLEMGSLSTAISNTTNKYINEGEISVTGGSYTAAAVSRALSVSFGTIHNKHKISVDRGVGAYGINGSSILNDINADIDITEKGIGILAYASGNTLETKYGTDKKIKDGTLAATDKVIEVENKGNITVAGEEGIGIYAELNNPSGTANFVRDNSLVKNSGKINVIEEKGIGIFSKGNKVELSGSGTSDIVVGKQGIGVFADNTTVSLSNPYGIEVKEEGTGIFVKDGSEVSAGNLKLTYKGTTDKSGVGIFYDNSSATDKINNTNIELKDKVNTKEGLIALYVKRNSTGAIGKLTNAVNIMGDRGYGIVTEGSEVDNTGNITFNNPILKDKPSVGMFSRKHNSSFADMQNSGSITMGNASIGMYGYKIKNAKDIKVGDKGIAIYSMGGNVDLLANSKIKIGKEKAIGLYMGGTSQVVTADMNSTFIMRDDSFAFVNMGTGNTINSNISNQSLENEAVYIYSKDKTGTVNNRTKLNSTGNYNYGIYSAGTVTNDADIDFKTGKGNVGVYSIYGGKVTNNRIITVGTSHIDTDRKKDRYAIAMAAGFTPNAEEIAAGKTPYTGNIVNKGTLVVDGEYSIGMYGTGVGTKVYNGISADSSALIKLKANNTTGIYLDNGAYGYNYGTIKSEGAGLKNLTGVVVKNKATLENHGLIELDAENALGVLRVGDETETDLVEQRKTLGIIKNYGTFRINGKVNTGSSTSPTLVDTKEEIEDIAENLLGSSDLSKKLSNGVEIVVPTVPSNEAIKINGEPIKPPQLALIGTAGEFEKKMQISKIGMYIDTSSRNYTTPILGLNHLNHLKKADLIIGTEAAQNTRSKYIMIQDDKILSPYNKMILSNTQISEWAVYSNSLTWNATLDKDDETNQLKALYLAKENYTAWAGKEPWPVDKKDSYNFLDGLEQRYGAERLGSRENQLFQKINGIGNNEEILFFQAIDEMMGHQYANV
ncbi:hypothetical protein FUSO5_08900, partial [Fusobacterium necrophorum BFTR-1]